MQATRRDCVKTPCSHQFHNKCLARWTRQSNTCPMCRASGMKYVVKRNMADALIRMKTAINAFVEASKETTPSYVRSDIFRQAHPKTVRVLKTVLTSLYFDLDKDHKALQPLYLDVVRRVIALDQKIFRTGLNWSTVYNAFYATCDTARSREDIRAVIESVDYFYVHFNNVGTNEPNVFQLFLLTPSVVTTRNDISPAFAFLKKLVKALRIEQTDGFIKALTKARKQWRSAKMLL